VENTSPFGSLSEVEESVMRYSSADRATIGRLSRDLSIFARFAVCKQLSSDSENCRDANFSRKKRSDNSINLCRVSETFHSQETSGMKVKVKRLTEHHLTGEVGIT
jgi:hypothetical protein